VATEYSLLGASLGRVRSALHRSKRTIGSTGRRLVNTKWGVRLLAFLGFLVIWQLVAWWKGPTWTPTVQAIVGAMVDVFTEGYYLTLLKSLETMFAGFLITLLIGIPIGVLMGISKIADDLFSPWVMTLFSSPKEALLPLLIILFGVGFEYRVSIVVLFALFFVIMNTAAGVHYADKQLLETARAFCTPRLRFATRVLLPAAAPFVVAGIRLGLGMAFKAMIIAELWISTGTGGLIEQVGANRQLDLFYAIAWLLVGLAIAIYLGLVWLEERLRHGMPEAR
jgi:ABC-type nitrate/sulfonate/bicarbonate transport system permease component